MVLTKSPIAHLFWLLTFLLLISSTLEAKSFIRVGLLIDGESREGKTSLLANHLRDELNALLASKYKIQLPLNKIVGSKWSVDRARENYQRLVADKSVDIIVSAGFLSSSAISGYKSYPKPVIAATFSSHLSTVRKLTKTGASGIKNIVYVAANHSIVRDLNSFYQVLPYKHIAIILADDDIELLRLNGSAFQRLMEQKQSEYRLLPISALTEGLSSKLKGVDAVYIGNIAQLGATRKKALISELNSLRLPTFGGFPNVINEAVLSTTNSPENLQKIARRIALNIEAFLGGEALSKLPTRIDLEEQLTINMQTAQAIGFSPRFALFSEARLVNEFIEKSDPSLNLEAVIREALEANLALKVERGNVAIAQENIVLAQSNYKPSLSVNATGMFVDEDQARSSNGGQAEETLSGNVKLEQLLFSEQEWGNITSQEYLLKAAQQAYNTQALDVVQAASSRYFDVLRARTARNIQNENIALTRKNLDVSEQREAAGYAGRSDVYRWKSQLASTATDLITAQNSYNLSKIQLNQLLNRPLGEPVILSEVSLTDGTYGRYLNGYTRRYVNNPSSLKVVTGFFIQEATNNSPEIKKLDANIAALERSLTSFKRKRYLPVISATAESSHVFDRSGAGSNVAGVDLDDDTWQAGINLSWTLYQGGAIGANIRQKLAENYQLKDEKKQFLQTIDSNVRAALLDLITHSVTLKTAKKSAHFAEKSLLMVEDAYAKGVATFVDLADAQQTAINSSQIALNSVYNFLNSGLTLERAIGRFSLLSSDAEKAAYIERLDAYFKSHH